jgi:hypothetical protein
MTTGPACPLCGETEALRGVQVDDDIAVTCQTCGATWMRGAPRCKTCGGEDIVPRPQAMSRTPRGNQLAFVGWREIPLCRTCDAEALSTSLSKNQPYVSASLFGPKDRVPSPPPPAASAPAPPAPPTDDRESAPRTRQALPSRSAQQPARNRLSRESKPTPASSQPPTVRQAVDAFLSSGPADNDPTAILMLAKQLGAGSRLSALEGEAAAKEIRAWFEKLYGSKANKSRDSARRTIVGAIDHWRTQGWIADDPAAGLR